MAITSPFYSTNHLGIQAVTGVLPPITPISANTYETHGILWYSLYDENMSSLTAASFPLQQIQSIAQLDEAQVSLSADPIDPDTACCSKHPRLSASCVFRPCSHLACAACLGETLMKHAHCRKCGTAVVNFVGVKDPLPQVTTVDDSTEEGGTSWDITDIEDLAREATDSGTVIVIHLLKDRVSALYSKPELQT